MNLLKSFNGGSYGIWFWSFGCVIWNGYNLDGLYRERLDILREMFNFDERGEKMGEGVKGKEGEISLFTIL